jgi:ribose 5-phosphate isomerase B
MSIVANKVNGIICGKVNTVEEAELTKSHNYANVIALSSKLSKRTFIKTPNSNEERHIKRVQEIREIEKNNA